MLRWTLTKYCCVTTLQAKNFIIIAVVNILQVSGDGGGVGKIPVHWVILGRKLEHQPDFSIFLYKILDQLSFSQKL